MREKGVTIWKEKRVQQEWRRRMGGQRQGGWGEECGMHAQKTPWWNILLFKCLNIKNTIGPKKEAIPHYACVLLCHECQQWGNRPQGFKTSVPGVSSSGFVPSLPSSTHTVFHVPVASRCPLFGRLPEQESQGWGEGMPSNLGSSFWHLLWPENLTSCNQHLPIPEV